MEISEVRSILDDLRSKGRLSSDVLVKENFQPVNEPYGDYLVAYELRFEPAALDMAFLAIWVTDTGRVAIQFEQIHRIAARLGRRVYRTALGHEPMTVSRPELELLMNNAATGRLEINIVSAFGFGFVSSLRIPRAYRVALRDMGYFYASRFGEIPEGAGLPRTLFMREILRNRPWARSSS